ncbi:DNA/RNA non-specific endonuclease [Kitasatospora sp. NPDC087315]|uniref:DNA/RNA non-specific endonuclease n=1 Tax=Kitasatospora sp. NPDC087315 TaxID=3364069 RepID=UPI00381EA238
MDAGNGGRATGVTACLDSAYLLANKGTETEVRKGIKPAGYDWARNQVIYWGGDRSDVNACHLLGAQLSGSGTNLANLVPCGSDANSYVGKLNGNSARLGPIDSMLHFENQVKAEIDGGNIVFYQVTPYYDGNRMAPYEIEMTYVAWSPGGRLLRGDSETVSNLIYTAGSGWKNLGFPIDSRSGQDAGMFGD